MTTKELTEQIKDNMKVSRKEAKPKELIHTGSTLMNLALSGDPHGGWVRGSMANLIGDSSSGKTLVALTMLAECSYTKEFDKYDLIFDDVEEANEFDMESMFGSRTTKRITKPINGHSNVIEDFRANVLEQCVTGKPFIYVLDSFDSLSSDAEVKKALEDAENRKKGKETKGSYGMNKAKISGEILRQVVAQIEETDSFILILSQTRDKPDSFFREKIRSGGNALKFFASHEVWMSVKGQIKKTHKGKDYIIGQDVKVKVSKNKYNGKIRFATFPIYNDYGVDDITSCINFLIDSKYWSMETPQKVAKNDMIKTSMTKPVLIDFIEEENKMPELVGEVANAWHGIEEALKVDRNRKFK